MSEHRIPLTVIGGYLGAGKTTLINRLLATDHGRRLAVLVNDFGSVNIDAALIASHDGETISLENGCVCCSIADSLGNALDAVLALEPAPDQIVIEASGVADPTKIAHYGQGWPGCRLDAVVTLADAGTIRELSEDQFVGELVTRQLRSGDLVLLTKTDLVPEVALNEVEDWIDTVTDKAGGMLRAIRGRVDPRLVLDLAIDFEIPDSTRESFAADELFESAVLKLPPVIERDRLEAALESWPDHIVRVKGIVTLANEGSYLVQRVARRWSIEPTTVEHRGSTLLVIALRDTAALNRLNADMVQLFAGQFDDDQTSRVLVDEIGELP